jgi:flagellin-specific chaperone FliS
MDGFAFTERMKRFFNVLSSLSSPLALEIGHENEKLKSLFTFIVVELIRARFKQFFEGTKFFLCLLK